MNIGATIKRLRTEHGLTQQQLSEYLSVSMQTISRWETSVTYPDVIMLPILAKRFNVTIDYLLNIGGTVMKTIETDRLLVREWEDSDADAFFELKKNSPQFIYYLNFSTVKDSLDTIKIWTKYQEMYPLILKESGKLIGVVGLVDVNRYKEYRELEVHICEKYNTISYSTETHKLILNYAFNDIGISVAFALCGCDNETLKQAMVNTGFVYEGTLRKFGRNMNDSMRYSIMKEEFNTENH
jgi:RimJ/RimL family protein N-acetyltransferase